MKPILVIEQEYSLRGLGLLGERLEASGLPYRTLGAWHEPLDEVDPGGLGAIVAMGGNAHAWEVDRIPALRHESVLLKEAVQADVPVFGICLGGQLLAAAVGGEVRAAARPEIGWLPIAPTDSAREDPVFRVLETAVGVYQWHSDIFEPPTGASVLARSDASPNQAFRVDGARAWGIQFHPETTPDLWEPGSPGIRTRSGKPALMSTPSARRSRRVPANRSRSARSCLTRSSTWRARNDRVDAGRTGPGPSGP